MVFISNLCFGGNPWSKTNRLQAQQRKQYEQQQRQRQQQREETMQKQQFMLRQQQWEQDAMTRREHSHSRSQTPQNVSQQPGQRQYRYAQPPAFDVARARDSSASSTHSSTATHTPTSFRPPPYYGGGAAMRSNTPLVPTPVPGAPRSPIVIRQETGPDDWNL